MEIIAPFTGSLRRQWRRRGYNRLSPSRNRRNLRVEKLGAGNTKRFSWRFRLGRKLRLAASPARLWWRMKNAYVNMMLRLGAPNAFGNKRIPKAREGPPMAYSKTEFENRLVFEIYKSMVSSFELGYTTKLS
ncbi:uncharacterized protein LOC127248521 [Andrographis paniculata]|uniref:uncharacterized protein LOC127248521 n=1 Tax=Andrographis paniculata TaxID=175694 RepID=UPI0021E7DB0D|nr:uncharacterized protein LOC127248521 [Andrographis paniculata]